MKTFLKGLFLFTLVFAGCFYAGKRYSAACALRERLTYLERGAFAPTPYPLMDHPFVLVVLGRNNGAFVEKTLRSIVAQKYEAYRVIYIDDASEDGSFGLAEEIVSGSGEAGRFTLVKNEERLGSAANVFRAVQECADAEIVVVLEESGWLAHEWVLSRLNQSYAHPDLWITYGQYQEYPGYQMGKTRLMDDGKSPLRALPCEALHLKTFYASLFKKIDERDLIDQGKFFTERSDLAYMLPMLEMAEGHSSFISEVLYVEPGMSQENEMAERAEKIIRAKSAYRPLSSLDEVK
jgi:hypothetical protein